MIPRRVSSDSIPVDPLERAQYLKNQAEETATRAIAQMVHSVESCARIADNYGCSEICGHVACLSGREIAQRIRAHGKAFGR
jgi:hypothetical protein